MPSELAHQRLVVFEQVMRKHLENDAGAGPVFRAFEVLDVELGELVDQLRWRPRPKEEATDGT